MRTRDASTGDADAMSRVLREIVALTGRERPSDADFVARHYIANPASIRCTVAVDEAGDVLGFQSLVRAEAGNRYDVPEGWGHHRHPHQSPRAPPRRRHRAVRRQPGGRGARRDREDRRLYRGEQSLWAALLRGDGISDLSGARRHRAEGVRARVSSAGVIDHIIVR